MPLSETQMELEGIILGEVSQEEKDRSRMTPLLSGYKDCGMGMIEENITASWFTELRLPRTRVQLEVRLQWREVGTPGVVILYA